ncbi:hypothetical protein ScPMuIL_002146, partial [Solemya velum]
KPDYATWGLSSQISGHVHSAGCTCSAGDGESCNHIAALLYALVDVTNRKKMDYIPVLQLLANGTCQEKETQS